MNRTTARRIAPVLVAVAFLAGCGGGSSDEGTSSAPSAATTLDSEVCSGYAQLQKSVEDLRSDPIDASAPPEEIQQQAAALSAKAATVKADLSKLSALSDGPVAAAVGEMNTKADELNEELTKAVADAQEEMGPKITAAQEELNAAYTKVTTALDTACPSN